MGPPPSRFIPYAGCQWAISELARHLGLSTQVMRWRVDNWEPERWAEPAAPKAKLTPAQAVEVRDRIAAVRGKMPRAAVVKAIATEHGMSRKWISRIGSGGGRKGWG